MGSGKAYHFPFLFLKVFSSLFSWRDRRDCVVVLLNSLTIAVKTNNISTKTKSVWKLKTRSRSNLNAIPGSGTWVPECYLEFLG